MPDSLRRAPLSEFALSRRWRKVLPGLYPSETLMPKQHLIQSTSKALQSQRDLERFGAILMIDAGMQQSRPSLQFLAHALEKSAAVATSFL
jgi:hypothetical protein